MRANRPAEDHRALRIVHALPGRIRVHVASLPAGDEAVVEARLRATAGVEQARVNPATRNVLVAFDPLRADEASVVAVIARAATPASPALRRARVAPAPAAAPAAPPAGAPPFAVPTAAAPPGAAPTAAASPASRLVLAGQLVVLGLDVALLLLRNGRRPPGLLAGASPWLPMALAVARRLVERGLRAAPAPAPSPA